MWRPGEFNTHSYNPLDIIRRDERMPTDCDVISSFMISLPTSGEEFWARSGRRLLSALIGYVLSSRLYEGQKNLRAVVSLISTGENFAVVLRCLSRERGIPEFVIMGFNQFLSIEDEVRDSILGHVVDALGIWNNDLVAAATDRSDFDIRELRRKPMAIFIGCSVAQLDIYRQLIKLFIQQVHDCLMVVEPGPDEPFQVLVMLDEFRQLGRVDSIVNKLSVNASYGFRMVVVLQDMTQLDELYGRATRMTTVNHCQVKLFVRINDLETADYVSRMLGNTTGEIRTPFSRPGSGLMSSRGHNIHYHQRPLRDLDEIRNLPKNKSILIVDKGPSYELKKLIYYRERSFKLLMKQSKGVRVSIPSFQSKKKIDANDHPVVDSPAKLVASPLSSAKTFSFVEQAKAESKRTDDLIETYKDDVTTGTKLARSARNNQPPSSETIPARTLFDGIDEVQLDGVAQNNITNVDEALPSCDPPLRKIDTVAAAKVLGRFRGLGNNFGDS
ncbi:MAG: type IV secretory system conjugative DNA transfer family protein [Hyphomicrobiales bacterium]|nr:type IV secretory system conjugative DNA transfer family protein [Hyphomicrobiales bacterium]